MLSEKSLFNTNWLQAAQLKELTSHKCQAQRVEKLNFFKIIYAESYRKGPRAFSSRDCEQFSSTRNIRGAVKRHISKLILLIEQ